MRLKSTGKSEEGSIVVLKGFCGTFEKYNLSFGPTTPTTVYLCEFT